VTGRLLSREDLAANASAFAAAVLLGASVVAVRVAVRDIPPTTLAVLRFGQGALVLLGATALVKPALLRVDRRSFRLNALLGAIFFSLFPLSFNAGLQFTQATRGALMLATMPVWSMLLARWFIGERLGIRRTVGVGLTLIGVLIVVSERGLNLGTDGRALLGDALVLLSAFWGALYGVLAKRALIRQHPLTVVSYAMLIGTLILLPIALWEGVVGEFGRLDSSLALIVLFLGIPGGVIAFGMWTAALARLSPTQVAVYVNLNPIVAAILGVLLLSERASPTFLLSFATVIAGVLLVNWPVRNRETVGAN
jgi:drug/metabolite transporter (DMT)-like permease